MEDTANKEIERKKSDTSKVGRYNYKDKNLFMLWFGVPLILKWKFNKLMNNMPVLLKSITNLLFEIQLLSFCKYPRVIQKL